jgi:hypothetical protein
VSDSLISGPPEDLETLSNEFAFVRFGKVSSGNGDRLFIDSPSRAQSTLLDPVVLEALTILTPAQLTRIVESALDPDLHGQPLPVAEDKR